MRWSGCDGYVTFVALPFLPTPTAPRWARHAVLPIVLDLLVPLRSHRKDLPMIFLAPPDAAVALHALREGASDCGVATLARHA